MKDYYKILDLQMSSTQDEIKSQYRLFVNAWHPDRFSSPEQKSIAENKLKDINEAYAILGNIEKRRKYDSDLKTKKFTPPSSQKTTQYANSTQDSNYQSARGTKADVKKEPPNKSSSPKHEPSNREPYSRSSSYTSQTKNERSEDDVKFRDFLRGVKEVFSVVVTILGFLFLLGIIGDICKSSSDNNNSVPPTSAMMSNLASTEIPHVVQETPFSIPRATSTPIGLLFFDTFTHKYNWPESSDQPTFRTLRTE